MFFSLLYLFWYCRSAPDVADRSTHQGFLSKYVPSGSDASQSSMSDNDNFVTPTFIRVKYGNGPDALSYQNNPAEHGPFATFDDKSVLHPTTQVQDSMAFTAARGEPSISSKDRVDVYLAKHALVES